MELSAMICACGLMYFMGWLSTRHPLNKPVVYLATLLALVMIMNRGYYWFVFERGEGFFTLNRMTALAVFLLMWFGGTLRGAYLWQRDMRAL